MIPPEQAIETVDISTSNYEPELGRAVGTVANVILKSGTNNFHGLVTEYVQNNDLNARAYFNTSTGHIAYNYFGGALGGPIKKDKLFFFGDFFRSPDHEANNLVITIPSPTWYTCNSSGYIDLSGAISGTKGQIYDPATGNASGQNRTPYPSNHIPCNASVAGAEGVTTIADPIALKLMGLLKAPNNGNSSTWATSSVVNDYASPNLSFQKNTNRYDAKIDYQITGKDHLSYRYEKEDVTIFQAPLWGTMGGGPANSAFEGTGTQHVYSTGLNYDRAFSSTFLTEARLGVAHYGNAALPSDYGSNDSTTIGIPGVNISQFTSGMVAINMGDFNSNPLIGYSASLPWVRGETNVDAVNHWTKIVRNHTFKFGADVRRIHDNLLQDQTYSARGSINFCEGTTACANCSSTAGSTATDIGNEMASLLLDVPNTVGRDVNTYFPRYRQWWIFAFGGDKWQVTPKLTLDLGLRWELYPPATPGTAQGFSNYNPTNNTLVIAGVGGNPNNLGMQTTTTTSRHAWALPTASAKRRSFAAASAISYTPFEDNTYAYNYPVRANNGYTAANSYMPAVLNTSTGACSSTQTYFTYSVRIPGAGSGDHSLEWHHSSRHSGSNTLNAAVGVLHPAQLPQPVCGFVERRGPAGPADAVQRAVELRGQSRHAHGRWPEHQPGLRAEPGIGWLSAEYRIWENGVGDRGLFRLFDELCIAASRVEPSLHGQSGRDHVVHLGQRPELRDGSGDDDGGLIFWLDQRHSYGPTDFDHKFNFEESVSWILPFGPHQKWLNSGPVASILGGWQTLRGGFRLLRPANEHYRQRHQHQHLRR